MTSTKRRKTQTPASSPQKKAETNSSSATRPPTRSSGPPPRKRARADSSAKGEIKENGGGRRHSGKTSSRKALQNGVSDTVPTIRGPGDDDEEDEEEDQEDDDAQGEEDEEEEESASETDEQLDPSPLRRGAKAPASTIRPPLGKTHASAVNTPTTTSRFTDKLLNRTTVTTMVPLAGMETPSRRGGATPRRMAMADRSARRKSARRMIERIVGGGDDDDGEGEDELSRVMYEDSEDENEEDEGGEGEVTPAAARSVRQLKSTTEEKDEEEKEEAPDLEATPSKRRPGRPKGTGRLQKLKERERLAKEQQLLLHPPSERRSGRVIATATTPSKSTPSRRARGHSPTPPPELQPHEKYFLANKPGAGIKTSDNTLAQLELLNHDEYFGFLNGSWTEKGVHHEEEIEHLHDIHGRGFGQWGFEMGEGFNICVFGYGSKRRLLGRFAVWLYQQGREAAQQEEDGEVKNNNNKIVIVNGYVRTITVREILMTVASAVDKEAKIPVGTAGGMLASLMEMLSAMDVDATAPKSTVTVVLHSIDSLPLRKPAIQQALSVLASHPRIRLICSADTPDFSLLWDSGIRSSFSFLFHDATTFLPFGPEIEAVDDVHELLGRKARRVGGKDGVVFVLRSLPENARQLFRVMVLEVLAALDDGDGGGGGGGMGMEYRMLYKKAEEEFVCSNDVGFRTLLKEFYDHQIIESKVDVGGTEMLFLPFRREELEGILEELMD